MKITELDLQTEGKRYKCYNRIFKVKNGDLVDIENNTYLRDENISIAYLLKLDFEEIKEMKNPYERVDNRDTYYIVNERGGVGSFKDVNDHIDDKKFNSLNYFNNKNYAEHVAFKETLMRNLDKFAWEHNAKVIDWHDHSTKYYIAFANGNNELIVDWDFAYKSNNIYFTSKEIAKMALEKFKEDLMKLYTWEFDF